jgi:hypothetical protein
MGGVMRGASLLLLVACDVDATIAEGRKDLVTSPPGDGQKKPRSTSGEECSGTGVIGVSTTTAAGTYAACGGPIRDRILPATKEEFIELLIGDWQLCSASSVFCGMGDGGFEIRRDGTWKRDRGANTDTTSFPESGTWTVLDSSDFNGAGIYQLNLNSGQRSVGVIPAITADGVQMHLDNFSVCAGDYAKIKAQTPVEPTPTPVYADEIRDRGCAMDAAAQVPFQSKDDLQNALVGYWALCSEQSPFCSNEEAGLEIASDGRWYKLYADESGRLWRGLGWERRGTWKLLDAGPPWNAPGTYQLNLEFLRGGIMMIRPELSGDRTQLHLNNNGACIGDYAKAEP